MPDMRAQNDLRRAADLGERAASLRETGGFRVPPVWALYEARPFALSPPLGFLPSLRVHAAVFFFAAISSPVGFVSPPVRRNPSLFPYPPYSPPRSLLRLWYQLLGGGW